MYNMEVDADDLNLQFKSRMIGIRMTQERTCGD